MGLQMQQFDAADLFGRLRLNFDVLRMVCNSLTDISDVLSFALTCSVLTEDAFRRRLRMSPVNLRLEKSVDSFNRFIFANEAARAPCIYGLKLPHAFQYSFNTSDPRFRTINERIVPILQAAVHLKYVDFPTATSLDPPHPTLAAAANMTSLRELSLTFVRDSPWKLLSTFRSPLWSLNIDQGDVNDEGITARLFHDHLANFASTLEVLELECIDFNIHPSLVTTQFTAVRSLTIYTIFEFNQFTMENLLRLFPNLDHTLVLDRFKTARTEDSDVYTHWRELSREAQKDHAWPRLDRVDCTAQLAFLMALQCPVRRMDIQVARHHGKRYLAPALRHNYPQQLHCVVPFKDGLGDLEGLFPSEGADTLTHLVMFADKLNIGWPEVKPIPWSQFRDKLIASVRHLRLTHLRIVFHYHVRRRNSEWDGDSMYIADETDLYPAATEFAGAIPTLRYIFLTTCGDIRKYTSRSSAPSSSKRVEASKWLASKAWQITHNPSRGDGPPNADAKQLCTELSASAAERLIDREELHLPQYEQDTLQECGDSDSET